MGTFGRILMRVIRVAAPLAIGVATDLFTTHPATVWLVPPVVATFKALRDKYPNSAALRWFPF
jgi:hypothetical protein